MDIGRHRIDLLLQLCQLGFVGIDIAALIQKQEDQKLNKLLMDDQVAHRIFFWCQLIDVIELAVQPLLKLGVKTENWNIPVKNAQQLLIFIGKTGGMGRHIKLDDQPLTGCSGRVLGLVESVRRDPNDIECLDLVGDTFYEVNGIGTQQDAQLIKGVKVLELHIDLCASDIIIKEVENSIIFFVDTNEVFVLVESQILNEHRELPR